MSIPVNDLDYVRLLKLARLIKDRGSDRSEMSIYVSCDGGYASIEMRGHGLPVEALREFFQYQPSIEEMERAKALLEGLVDEGDR